MSIIKIPAEYADRVLQEAGGPRKRSAWLRQVLKRYFDPYDPQNELIRLRQENDRLKGELAGLRYALSVTRPASLPLLNESADDDRQYTPYPAHGDPSGTAATSRRRVPAR